MLLRCAVCDDIPAAARLAKDIAEKVFAEMDVSCEISLYSSSKQLFFDIGKSNPFDILLLDVEMPDVTGLELAITAKKTYKNCLIIFLTSHLQYAVNGYELDVFRFVPKCEISTRLKYALFDAVNCIERRLGKTYIIQKSDLCEKIPYDDILYITKDGKNSVLHIDGHDPISVRKPLSVMFCELNSDEFIFIDRGCIANMTNASRIKNREWTCKNGKTLAVSRSAYSKVKHSLLAFWDKPNFD